MILTILKAARTWCAALHFHAVDLYTDGYPTGWLADLLGDAARALGDVIDRRGAR